MSLQNVLSAAEESRSDSETPNATREPDELQSREYWGPRRELVENDASNTGVNFGRSALAELISEKHSLDRANFAEDFAFDPANFGDWHRFTEDFSFEMEPDEFLDFRAIALASYLPDIQFWLEGNRWAGFNSVLPGYKTVTNTQSDGKTTEKATQKPFTNLTMGNRTNGFGTAKTGLQKEEDVRVFSLSGFLLGMLSKLVRLPITYVILAICLGALLINYYRQPRA